MEEANDASVNYEIKVLFPEHPAFGLVSAKAGVIGSSIGQRFGTILGQVAARFGVLEVPGEGFRCGPGYARAGSFTDPTGSTCGSRLSAEDLANAARAAADAADAAESASSVRESIASIMEQGDDFSPTSKAKSVAEKFSTVFSKYKNRPSRVRLSHDTLMPESHDESFIGRAVSIIRARRPEMIYSGLTRNLGDKPDELNLDDIASEQYLRSLGMAVITEAINRPGKVPRALGANQGLADLEKRVDTVAITRKAEIDAIVDDLTEIVDIADSMPGQVVHGLIVDGRVPLATVGPKESRLTPLSQSTISIDFDGKEVDIHFFVPLNSEDEKKNLGHSDVYFTYQIDGVEYSVASGNATSSGKKILKGDKKEEFSRMAESIERSIRDGYNPEKHGSYSDFMAKKDPSEKKFERIVESSKELQVLEQSVDRLLVGIDDINADAQEVLSYEILQAMRRNGYVSGIEEPSIILDRLSTKKVNELIKNANKKGGGLPTIVSSEDFTDEEFKKVEDALNWAKNILPASFSRQLQERGLLLFRDPKSKNRAYATSSPQGKFGIINVDNSMLKDEREMRSVMLHELMHIFQEFNLESQEAEYLTFALRVGPNEEGFSLKDLFPNSKYRKNEVTFPDDLDNAYMFKIYQSMTQRPHGVRETAPVAMEMLFGGTQGFGGDVDMMAFIIGLMMDLGFGGK